MQEHRSQADGGDERALRAGWRLLWDGPAPYRLAGTVAAGTRAGGKVISRLHLALPGSGSIPLVRDEQHGYVSIALGAAAVEGLHSIEGRRLDYDPATRAFRAHMAIASLRCAGRFTLRAAHEHAPVRPRRGAPLQRALAVLDAPVTATAAPTPAPAPAAAEDLAVADDYRDQLAGSENGLGLLGLYYRHNDTLDEVMSGSNAFTQAWPAAHPTGPGRTTSYYAAITSQAARQPAEQAAEFNEAQYRYHGFYMQVILLKTVQALAPSAPEPAAYHALAEDIGGMGTHAERLGASTVGGVMDAVASAPAAEPPRAMARAAMAIGEPGAEDAALAAARAHAEADYEAWEHAAAQARAARPAHPGAAGEGRWHASFPGAALVLSGVLHAGRDGGPPVPEVRTAHVTAARAVPVLEGGGELAPLAAGALGGAVWLHDVLAHRLRDALAGPAVRGYLGERLAQATALALGPLPSTPAPAPRPVRRVAHPARGPP